MTAPESDGRLAGESETARFRRADAVFDEALALEPAACPAFLDRACAGDPALRDAVDRLLRADAHADAAGFLAAPAAAGAAALLDGTPDDGRTAQSDHAASDDPPTPFVTPGTRVGRYRLVRTIGRGGMGTVWLARDERLERDVAVKLVHGGGAAGRADREARAAARLDHPHVAGVYDVGETGDGALWFAMPYCTGGSLAERLRAGALPAAEAVRVARQLAAALAAAHAHGIVHRDVKPGNVLFDAAGNARLGDFGIAKLAGAETTRAQQGLVGTIAYLAPEQIAGEPVDHRADLWALGVTLYEMLAGRRPFGGEHHGAVLRAILLDHPPPLPPRGVPPALAALVRRLLARDVAERPASAAAVEAALAALDGGAPPQSGVPITTPPEGSRGSAPAAPAARGPRRRVAAAAAAALLAAAALGGYAARAGRASAPRAAAGATNAAAPPRPVVRAPGAAIPAAAPGVIPASVAVLPFANVSAPADEPFADGLTDEVITTLGRVPGLKVSSRTSAFALRRRELPLRAIADTLGVASVLEASVRRDGERVRVSAALVRAADERVLWRDTYDVRVRRLRDLLRVQEEIARAIVGALRPRLGGAATAAPTARAGTQDLAAYDDFQRATFLRQRRNEESLRRAVDYFQRAVARDPAFARAWAGLANTYVLQVIFGNQPPATRMPLARQAARRALALDPDDAEAHTALAHILRVYDFDWAGSLRESERAMSADPDREAVRVLYAITLFHLGHTADAERVLQAARAADPLDFSALLTLGRIYYTTGRVPEGVASLRAALELNPLFSYGFQQLGHAELAGRRPAAALDAFRRAAALNGARDSAHLAYALAVTGQPDTARAIVRALETSAAARPVSPVGMAAAHVGLGDRDAAFRWLERAWDARAPGLDAIGQATPMFAPLHGDPRWRRLLARAGLAR